MTGFIINNEQAQELKGQTFGQVRKYNPIEIDGVGWVISALEAAAKGWNDLEIYTPPKTNEQILSERKTFGNKLIEDFSTQRIGQEITTEQSVTDLQVLMPVEALLRMGFISPALDVLRTVQTTETFTQLHKDAFILQLETYLANE